MTETTRPKLRVNEEEARQKIQARIEEGQQLSNWQIHSYDEFDSAIMEANNWSDYNRDLLIALFDNLAPISQYRSFGYMYLVDKSHLGLYAPSFQDEVKEYQGQMVLSINSLEGIRERLELYEGPSDMSQPTFGDEVFIVHGHDDEAKETVARFVENFGIEATILHEQANRGQTIPEKFEEHAGEAGFAIILLTPDDVGASKDETDDPKPRARQNVVLELGYFWGRLGRGRVCVLYKEGVELPSDMQGLLYVPMDISEGWKPTAIS